MKVSKGKKPLIKFNKERNKKKAFIFSTTILGRSNKYKKPHFDNEEQMKLFKILNKEINPEIKLDQKTWIEEKIENYINDSKKQVHNERCGSRINFDKQLIEQIVYNQEKSLTLKEIIHRYKDAYKNAKFSYMTFYRCIRRIGFRFVRKSVYNRKANYPKSENVNLLFIQKICECIENNHILLYCDESSFKDNKNTKQIWTIKNNPVKVVNNGRIPSVSVMAIISTTGVIHHKVTMETFTSNDFIDFLFETEKEIKKDQIMREKMENLKITVVLDNAKIHTPRCIKTRLKNSKLNILYQPVYSPFFNCAENLWAMMKRTKSRLIHNNV